MRFTGFPPVLAMLRICQADRQDTPLLVIFSTSFVDAPSLEVFKTRLDRALSSLV